MRGQLNGLKTLIDAVPTITSAPVDAVSTLTPGDPATFSVQVAGGVLSLTFGIHQGYAGPQGPPFANECHRGWRHDAGPRQSSHGGRVL